MISMKKSYVYKSPYAVPLQKYISERAAILTSMESETVFLEGFDQYLFTRIPDMQPITEEVLSEWLKRKEWEKKISQSKRLNMTKRICRYLHAEGYDVFIPSQQIRHAQSDYIPYIFTKDEMRRIFTAADNTKSTIRSPYLHCMVPITFQILYGCGFRSSEMVNLRLCDVDTEQQVFHIRDTKFSKSRYVPFSNSLGIKITRYIMERYGSMPDQQLFFLTNPEGRAYSTQAIYGWMRKILYEAGIPHGGKGIGPRIHDFRHTFAVHSLQKCILENHDPAWMLPILSAYLGHKDLRGTQYYLRLTVEMYPEIINALKQTHGELEGGEYNGKK